MAEPVLQALHASPMSAGSDRPSSDVTHYRTKTMSAVVAVIGRPNVGKSTFFNRVTRTGDALVDDVPGVTRDRHFGQARWNDTVFTLVDTGGFAGQIDDPFAAAIQDQVLQAIEDADAVVVLFDGKQGISPYDREMIHLVRAAPKPVFYAVNKIDGPEQESGLVDFYDLGLDTIYPISSAHRFGLNDFLDALVDALPPAPRVSSDGEIGLAVVGRPNVGKSSLINRLLGENRHLVSDVPGTTRDAVDSVLVRGEKTYRIIDTAGIRRKGRVKQKIEKFSVIKALKSLDRCDVALIVLDASEGITDQDISIAGYAYDRGCGCVFLFNKWDLVEGGDREARRFHDELRMAAKFLSFAPAITISALTGRRVQRIYALIDDVARQHRLRIATGQLNRLLEAAIQKNEPSLHRGRRLKFYYAAQVTTGPPTFVVFVNYPDAVHFSYQRYLINQIREGTALDKTPIRLIFRQRSGKIDFSRRRPAAGRKPRKR
ncbi:MAG: ribosome biogenesis GTPase Der [Desulfobacterales bacterium]|jgi:GTP-binding protein